MNPITNLSAYRRALTAPDTPLPEVDISLACLKIDRETALAAANGHEYVAHLWAIRQLCDDLVELRSPRAALVATSQAIADYIAAAAKGRGQ